MVAVLCVRTEWLRRRTDGVFAASCGQRGRHVGRKDRVVAASYGQRGRRVRRKDRVVAVSSVRAAWLTCWA